MDRSSIRPFYADWAIYNRHIVDVVREMTPDQLAIEQGAGHWPLWATVGHMAGARVYWLCRVLGEPGADSTPWPDADALETGGWEDDLDHPRSGAELAGALESTWAVIEGCLDRWTPEMLDEPIIREWGDKRRSHTRQSILLRMLSHDAYHAGELSQTLGVHGLTQIDLWPPDDHPPLSAE